VVRDGQIEVNESLLTGESDPIIKKKGDTLYSGSFVVSGTCHAQATAIGKDIYIQKLTNQAKKYKKPESDLLGSLKIIIRTVGALIIPLGLSYSI
jgi:cation-transporting P-type ATPase E